MVMPFHVFPLCLVKSNRCCLLPRLPTINLLVCIMGVPLVLERMVAPSTTITFLGIGINTIFINRIYGLNHEDISRQTGKTYMYSPIMSYNACLKMISSKKRTFTQFQISLYQMGWSPIASAIAYTSFIIYCEEWLLHVKNSIAVYFWDKDFHPLAIHMQEFTPYTLWLMQIYL